MLRAYGRDTVCRTVFKFSTRCGGKLPLTVYSNDAYSGTSASVEPLAQLQNVLTVLRVRKHKRVYTY